MSEDADPIAYTALRAGTPVQSSDGQQFGTVAAVLTVEEVDVFDGIVVDTDQGTRFVDADHVGSIYTSYVRTTLSADEASALPVPDQDAIYEVDPRDDTGTSLGDRFGRMFGRGTWKGGGDRDLPESSSGACADGRRHDFSAPVRSVPTKGGDWC